MIMPHSRPSPSTTKSSLAEALRRPWRTSGRDASAGIAGKDRSITLSTFISRSRLNSPPSLTDMPRRSSCQWKNEKPSTCWAMVEEITVAIMTAMVSS